LLGDNGAGGTWIQQAKGGTLFLIHLQNLPKETQGELVSVLRNNSHTFRLNLRDRGGPREAGGETAPFNEELLLSRGRRPAGRGPVAARERPEISPPLL